MHERRPGFDLEVSVVVHAVPTDGGGRRTPIESGYRPLTTVEVQGHKTLIGLSELLLEAPIHPGSSGEGLLRFHRDVADLVRSLLRPGSELSFAEGSHDVASAKVIDIRQTP